MKPIKREKFDGAVRDLFAAGDLDRDDYVTLGELQTITRATPVSKLSA